MHLQLNISQITLKLFRCSYCHDDSSSSMLPTVSIDFSLTVKAATFIFISGRGSAISSAIQGKSGSIYNLVKNK